MIVNNYFAPLRALLKNGVDAGFIAESSLGLMQIVDLDGGEETNADESRVIEWGTQVVDRIRAFSGFTVNISLSESVSCLLTIAFQKGIRGNFDWSNSHSPSSAAGSRTSV